LRERYLDVKDIRNDIGRYWSIYSSKWLLCWYQRRQPRVN